MNADLLLLRLGALFDRAGDTESALECYAAAREVKQMTIVLDEIVGDAADAEAARRHPMRVVYSREERKAKALAELEIVRHKWRETQGDG